MFVGLKSSMERIFNKFTKLELMPKRLVKIGLCLFLLIFAAGTFFAVGDRYFLPYNPDYDYISNLLVKNSFSILAEFIFGAVVMDFVFGRN